MGFAKVRLFVDQPLGPGQPVALSEGQAHYLRSVMRLGAGAQVLLFNGRDGEWRARLDPAGRRQARLVAEVQTAPLRLPPDLWLVFAPLKKARTDYIVEKATELGAARILPVQTRFTNADRIRQDRLQAHAVEAAEQCGGTFVPVVDDLQPLDRLLDGWPAGRRLMWCDEHLAGQAVALPGIGATTQWGGRADDAGAVPGGAPPPPSPPHKGEGRREIGGTSPDLSGAGRVAGFDGDAGPASPRPPSPPWGGDGGGGHPGSHALATRRPASGPWAILIGPEGGFAEAEQARIRAMPGVQPVSLGPRILRADTAAVAALTLWQAALGDWR